MSVPNDRKYSKSHEWFRTEGDIVTMGITQFAADELTDITYVELPAVGKSIAAGAVCGEIESVKATSDLYSAVAGVVTAVNPRLAHEPELVNNDPFNEGWMLRLRVADRAPLNALMDGPTYEKQLGH